MTAAGLVGTVLGALLGLAARSASPADAALTGGAWGLILGAAGAFLWLLRELRVAGPRR